MNEQNEVRDAEATTILEVSSLKTTTETVVQIFTAIGTAVALILLAFGYISPAAGDNEAEARGVTNFDSITLSEDLVVGDDVTITGALSVGGDDAEAIYAASTTVTGTLAVAAATHGLSAITAAGCTLGATPSTSAGAPALCWVGVSGTTATITVEQDDWTTNATSPVTINYWIIGTP
jgi:hypothetical protein